MRRVAKGVAGAVASLVLSLGVLGGVGGFNGFEVFSVFGGEAYAVSLGSDDLCSSDIDPDLRKTAGCDETGTVTSPIKSVVKVLLYAVGIASIVMVIVSGVQMTISAGNSGKVTKAKMTLIYALAGLALSILAYVIVEFVVGQF